MYNGVWSHPYYCNTESVRYLTYRHLQSMYDQLMTVCVLLRYINSTVFLADLDVLVYKQHTNNPNSHPINI